MPPESASASSTGETEIPAVLKLAWKVFLEFESPVYPPEGTEEFRKTLRDEDYLSGIEYIGAFEGDDPVGVIGFRPVRMHICFFFVDGKYQRRGIGTGMFRYLRELFPERDITLNSSPYGIPFYKHLGFTETDEEQSVNGIRFTPMILKGEKDHAEH